ncbi:hypothetical protein AKJ09_10343 [Labilithrix luteola]|uniref:Uncharacterized protein n=1 Tax=Labilithrix luteola TaxID=1391654 RepID=A0A0K1QE25_9BACT|nr:hypothetical protein AKJ09_10343 [Labilithrix luteola]
MVYQGRGVLGATRSRLAKEPPTHAVRTMGVGVCARLLRME